MQIENLYRMYCHDQFTEMYKAIANYWYGWVEEGRRVRGSSGGSKE